MFNPILKFLFPDTQGRITGADIKAMLLYGGAGALFLALLLSWFDSRSSSSNKPTPQVEQIRPPQVKQIRPLLPASPYPERGTN